MFMESFSRGLQASVRNNYTAYGYSVMITASFGVLATQERTRLGFIFLFLAGAIAAFVAIELIVSKGLERTPRGEPMKVEALGAAFSFGSVGVAVGAAALATVVMNGWIAWLLGAFSASAVYVLLSGLEIALAAKLERKANRNG
jgi:hypothetical protein